MYGFFVDLCKRRNCVFDYIETIPTLNDYLAETLYAHSTLLISKGWL